MEKSTAFREAYLNGNHHHSFSSSSASHRHVSYSIHPQTCYVLSKNSLLDHCGYGYIENQMEKLWCSCGICGYELNLSSSNRNTSTIGSKYGKSIKRGKISFFFIDESRFTQTDPTLPQSVKFSNVENMMLKSVPCSLLLASSLAFHFTADVLEQASSCFMLIK
ncbi:hypothetical protein NC653_014186 [Populus alba x Populus x berolinensis]|uniref:Uncharacterized protein n=1 Tax=Populus alba x Populus x berolinensis TaxID=444605 RepID=A0AAD6QWL7_9ROSI|nr:hypothetical protein NC653_014186 [Populus alba x Populus x berolinensis]